MTKLVIFDCDGVLIDSEIISARMLVEALAQLGVTIDLDYVAQHFLGRSYPTVMASIRRDFGLDLPPQFEDDYRSRLLAAFEAGLKIMPGVAEVVARLAVPLCVATSSSPARAQMSLTLVGAGTPYGAALVHRFDGATGQARAGPVPACRPSLRGGAGRLSGD